VSLRYTDDGRRPGRPIFRCQPRRAESKCYCISDEQPSLSLVRQWSGKYTLPADGGCPPSTIAEFDGAFDSNDVGGYEIDVCSFDQARAACCRHSRNNDADCQNKPPDRSLLMNDHVYALPILGVILEWAPRHRPAYADQLATHANSSSRGSTSVGLTRKRISD
jgi:hypothetical protein